MYNLASLGAVKGQIKKALPVVLIATAGLLTSQSASAVALNLDYAPNPDIFSSFISVNYDATTDLFTANGFASLFTDYSSLATDITGGNFSLSAIITDTGVMSAGTFSISGDLGADTGVILGGDLTAFGFEAGNPSFEFAIDATSGYLSPLFGNAGLILNGTGFTTFADDFSTISTSTSDVKAVVPVPAAVWLFGTGLIGLVGVARRHSGS